MFESVMFRSPRSTEPMYVRCSPATSASASWESPRAWRSALTRSPKLRRIAVVSWAVSFGNVG